MAISRRLTDLSPPETAMTFKPGFYDFEDLWTSALLHELVEEGEEENYEHDELYAMLADYFSF